jgi:O-antigen/teichoic acid export membrane protein
VFLASRAVNGLLALIHVSLVVRAVGGPDAGRFFLVWTAAWLLATGIRFGVDGILPRVVAEAIASGSPTPSSRGLIAMGSLLGLIALPGLLVVLDVPLTPTVAVATLVLSWCWAATLLCAALLKAYGHVGLSGVTGFVMWSVGPVLAPAILLFTGGSWLTLLAITAALAAGGLVTVVGVTVRTLGWATSRRLAARSPPLLRLEADNVGAALLSSLYEVIVWLPVLLAALVGVGPAATAAIFAATRVAGLCSWGYQAVVAVLTPRIASALAARRLAEVRRLLVRGAVAGGVITTPVCVAGALGSKEILRVFDPSFGPYASVLTLLILGRILDAMAGPVGEALLVGRRTWLDSSLLGAGIATGGVVSLVLAPRLGELAVGVGAATAFGVANGLRVVAVVRLLARGWGTEGRRRTRASLQPALALICACGAALAAASLWLAEPGAASAVWLGVGAAALAAAGLLWFGVARHGATAALCSPILVVALVLGGQFALRPASLVLDPESATEGLRSIGFAWGDVTRAAALGVAGLTAFGAGFIAIWRRAAVKEAKVRIPSASRTVAGLTVAILVGCGLWGALFLRLGGPAALLDNPAALHLGQFGGGYGVLGMLLCLGAALVALWRWLQEPARPLMLATVAGLATGALASVCLATRGPLIATLFGAAAMVLRYRRPSTRSLLAAGASVALLVGGLALMRTAREYAQEQPLPAAIESTFHTQPLTILTAELVEFDHLVGVERLVPEALPWLDGRSFAEVPVTFLPRALSPEKPLPVDFALSEVLYGAGAPAGTPFTIAGEAYWNFGLEGAIAALFLLGAAAGLLWRSLSTRPEPLAAVATSLLYGYTYLVLTRPLAPMLLTTALAIAAAAIACGLGGLWDPRAELRRGGRAVRRTLGAAAPPTEGLDSLDLGARANGGPAPGTPGRLPAGSAPRA